MKKYSSKIGSSITEEQQRITAEARRNAKAMADKVEGYRDYADQITSRLARAVGMGIEDEDEALAHLRKTAKKVLSQLAQGRQPFITYKQVLVGMQRAEVSAMTATDREESDLYWMLSVRLGHLADEISGLALADVMESVRSSLLIEETADLIQEYRELTEHYLLNSVSIGRVLAVNPRSLYQAYSKKQKICFVTYSHLQKALKVAEKAGHTYLWHGIKGTIDELDKCGYRNLGVN